MPVAELAVVLGILKILQNRFDLHGTLSVFSGEISRVCSESLQIESKAHETKQIFVFLSTVIIVVA